MPDPNSIVVQQSSSPPAPLILLFHGVGGNPEGLVPLGERLARAVPSSTVVCIAGPNHSPNAGGREWFAVSGITEANRPERVAQAMPGFIAGIGEWQRCAGAAPAATTLVGFSQGGMMSLEASVNPSFPAARVIAIGSRFARLPDRAPAHTSIHFVHGQDDAVIPYRHAVAAANRLRELGSDVTIDLVAGTGHRVSGEITERAVIRLLAQRR